MEINASALFAKMKAMKDEDGGLKKEQQDRAFKKIEDAKKKRSLSTMIEPKSRAFREDD